MGQTKLRTYTPVVAHIDNRELCRRCEKPSPFLYGIDRRLCPACRAQPKLTYTSQSIVPSPKTKCPYCPESCLDCKKPCSSFNECSSVYPTIAGLSAWLPVYPSGINYIPQVRTVETLLTYDELKWTEASHQLDPTK